MRWTAPLLLFEPQIQWPLACWWQCPNSLSYGTLFTDTREGKDAYSHFCVPAHEEGIMHSFMGKLTAAPAPESFPLFQSIMSGKAELYAMGSISVNCSLVQCCCFGLVPQMRTADQWLIQVIHWHKWIEAGLVAGGKEKHVRNAGAPASFRGGSSWGGCRKCRT